MDSAQGMSQPGRISTPASDLAKLPLTASTPPLGSNSSASAQDGAVLPATQQQDERYASPLTSHTGHHMAGPPNEEHYWDAANMIKTADAGIVRQAIRDNWEKCLTGSDYHSAFILNATLRKASSSVVEHIAKHFSQGLVQAAKSEMLGHLKTEDFDGLSDLVLSKVSNQFLDKALARRLETIEAQILVNALARAERLGYDVQDIVERPPGGPEQVIPSVSWTMPSHPAPQQMPPPPPHAAQQPPHGQPQAPVMQIPANSGITCCRRCSRPCSGEAARVNHEKKEACDPNFTYEMLGKLACFHCGVSFGSSGGVTYHIKTKVCGGYDKSTIVHMQQLLRTYIAMRDSRRLPPPSNPPGPKRQETNPPIPPALPRSALMTNNDQFSHLTLKKRQEYESEAAAAEAKYGELMREAHTWSEPRRTEQLQKLKNSYNTKQSTTRKKYGIRIVKRTKEEMDAERVRLFNSPRGPEIYNNIGPIGIATPSKRGVPEDSAAPTQLSSRPRTEEPRQRVPLEQMGGLSGSSASAETTDPTAYITSSQPRGFAQMQQVQASPRKNPPGAVNGTQSEPMSISSSTDDSSELEEGGNAAEDASDETSDDEDIPAR